MALEDLLGLTEIGGFNVGRIENDDIYIEEGGPIHIDDINNVIAFRLQNGPIKENGVNGCQVDTLIHAASLIIVGLNSKFACEENKEAFFHLDAALHWLAHRTYNRGKRGVKGLNKL